jgi:phosphoglycerate dehydrogenase-like enzyme
MPAPLDPRSYRSVTCQAAAGRSESLARLEGKVAVITGAGRGIGRATAVRFAGEGPAVVINDVDVEPAKETASLVKDAAARPWCPRTTPSTSARPES